VDLLFLLFFCGGYAAAIIVPVARIFKRVGISPWVAIFAMVPFVNLFGLWLFAFSPWPSDSAAAEQEAEWSEADKEKFRQMMRQQ
jgi:hypothetical protein